MTQDHHFLSTLIGWLRAAISRSARWFGRVGLTGIRRLGNTSFGQFVRRFAVWAANSAASLFAGMAKRTRKTAVGIRRTTAAIVAPLLALARLDRRTLCWAAASVTGGLALLLMLSWQVFALLDQVHAADTEELAAKLRDGEQLQLQSGLNEQPLSGRPVPSETNIFVTGIIDPEPPVRPEGLKKVPNEFGQPKDHQTTSPFEYSKSPAEPTPETSTVHSEPMKTVNSEPVRTSGKPELPNPFAEPPVRGADSPVPQTVEFGNPFGPEPALRTIVEPKRDQPITIKTVSVTSISQNALSLEIVRTDSALTKPDDAGRVLVTSLSAASDLKTDENDLVDSAGWTAVRWLPQGTGILPIRYVQSSLSQSSLSEIDHGTANGSITHSATANARWTVGVAKLQYDIILPNRIRVGERIPIQLRVTNIGAAAAENVSLQIDLPEELAYSVGGKLTHTVGSLKPGAHHVARLTPVAIRSGNVVVSGQAIAEGISQPDRHSLRIDPSSQTGRNSLKTSQAPSRSASSFPCCGGEP